MNSGTASVPVEPFDDYVRRRARSTKALSDGEAITAAVGLLRGYRLIDSDTRTVRWWLTADGRPTVVDDDDGADSVTATARCLLALTDLVDDPATRALIDAARTGVLARHAELSEATERCLFRHAQPRPLVLGPLVPVPDPVSVATPPRGPGAGLLALVDADLSEGVWSVARDLRDRLRASRPLRITVSVVSGAAVAVAAVLAFAAPEDGPAAGSAFAVSGSIATPTASEPALDSRMPLSDDVVEAARALLARASTCDVSERCPRDVWEDGVSTGDPLLPVDDATVIELVDDFGGVCVIRVDDRTASQYVTLVSRNDRWLVRTVRTITDQPS